MKAFNDPTTRKEREKRYLGLTSNQLTNLTETEKEELYFLIRDRNFGIYTREEQGKLRNAKICVAGQGCVGELAAAEVARLGFGTVRIIDQDTLELSNLNRNAYARYSQIGRPKTENMAQFLRDATPDIEIEVINEMIDTRNVKRAFEGIDVVIMGIDNMYARIIVHRAAKEMGIPVITMSGGPQYRAMVSTLMPYGVDYETLLNFPTKGADLDIPNEELDHLHHELRVNRAKYAMEHGADPEWAKLYISGERRTWSITPERAYITSTLCAHEAVNIILRKPLMAEAPKIISIDLSHVPDLVTVQAPPVGKYWDYKIW